MTEQATGAGSKILMGFEATYLAEVTSGFSLPINSDSLRASRNQVSPKTIRHADKNPVEPFDGNKSVDGQIVVPVDSIAFWYWMTAALGTCATTGAASPYTHVWKTGAASRGSVCIEKQFLELDTPLYFLYQGCKITNIGFSFGGDGELLATFGISGASETKGTSSFDSTPTEVDFARLSNLHGSIEEGGGELANSRSFSLNIDFGCDLDNYVIGGAGVRRSIPDGIIGVTGDLDYLFEDATVLDKAIASTESSLEYTLNGGTASQLIIAIPELQYSLNSPTIGGPAGVGVNLGYAGYYGNDSDAAAVKISLVNGEAHAA